MLTLNKMMLLLEVRSSILFLCSVTHRTHKLFLKLFIAATKKKFIEKRI